MTEGNEVVEVSGEQDDARQPQQAGGASGWYSLPLEIRQIILLQALEISIPQKEGTKQLLCLLKKLAKVSYHFGQDDLLPPLPAIDRQLKDAFRLARASAIELRDSARKTIEREEIAVGPRWHNALDWPFCKSRSCPVCGPHFQVTKLFYNIIFTMRPINECQAALGEAFWRLDQMKGHRERLNMIGHPDADTLDMGTRDDTGIQYYGARRADDQPRLLIAKRGDPVAEIRTAFEVAAAQFSKL